MADTPIPALRVCTKCGEAKPATTEYFGAEPRFACALQSRCRLCAKEAKRIVREAGGYKGADPLEPRICSRCRTAKPTHEGFAKNPTGRGGYTTICKKCLLPARVALKAPVGFKKCTGCGEIKAANAEYFYASKRGRYGFQSSCIPCQQSAIQQIRWRDIDSWRARCSADENKRRARKAKVGGEYSAADVVGMLAAQKSRCWWCSKPLKKYHVDHRFPLSKGGTNSPANLVLACPRCNLRKSAKMPWETERPRLL